MAIKETTFGPKKYLALKKSISISQITDKNMYDEAGSKLGAYMGQHGVAPIGGWSVIYFMWDQEAGKTDIAIGFPIADDVVVEDSEFSLVEVPESKVAVETLLGAYSTLSSRLGDTHQALNVYLGQNGLSRGDFSIMAIEEYATNPETEPNTEKWETNIYYFHN